MSRRLSNQPMSSSRRESFLVTDAFDDMFAEDEAGLGEPALDFVHVDDASIAPSFGAADADKVQPAPPSPPAADIGHQSFDTTSFAPQNINATLHGTPAPPATSRSTGSTGSAGSAGIPGHKQGILRLGSIDAWRVDHGIAEPDVPATVSQLPVEIRSVAEWQEHNVLPPDSESGEIEMVEEHVPLEKQRMPLEEEAPTFMSESHLEPQFDMIEPVMAHTQFAPKADNKVQESRASVPLCESPLLRAHAPVVVTSAYRGTSGSIKLPDIKKSPAHKKVELDALAKTSRSALPSRNTPLTWSPDAALNSDGNSPRTRDCNNAVASSSAVASKKAVTSSVHDSASTIHTAPERSDSREVQERRKFMQRAALASFDASRFDTLLGPPPPPLATSLRVLSGEDEYPEAEWGERHLVVGRGASALAKFGGGGALDVPCVSSVIEVTSPPARAYWEVRVEKKIGLLKFGLGHFHDKGPGDTGLEFGNNWTDRRGAGCTCYLDSDQGDIFEGTRCISESPSSHQMLAGDIVSIELIKDEASFFVNYKLYASGIKVHKFPVRMCVLFIFQGDHVTLLRNEIMTHDEYAPWLESRHQRAEVWTSTTHRKLAIGEAAHQQHAPQRDDEREAARERDRQRTRENLEIERIRVEESIAISDRQREERKRRERDGEMEMG
eukprot:CAMPEP_0179430970 /NCGR_PEP_ID=MMETSP0799-20121207/15972_1 /TAXON_ID=46947 /ORGANISM="Geminigera cryophila, Strain CCMP2564" /LENGTH=666 /DNA_ID=CAMNT_0021207657 /DNA_START=158 /DNA_END=2154 /DNA_ORIENTATION=+